ncbi:MAG: hypothetical protein IJ161_08370 [Bacteroidales bacterium]|nr:hypothetical protein [Bacteroidales bacterium]
MKVCFRIENAGDYYSMIGVTVDVPALPRVGERVWLSLEMKRVLISEAIKDYQTFLGYTRFLYGWKGDNPELIFCGAMYVIMVLHDYDNDLSSDTVLNVILNDEPETDSVRREGMYISEEEFFSHVQPALAKRHKIEGTVPSRSRDFSHVRLHIND